MNATIRYWPVDAEGHPIGPPIDAPGLALVARSDDAALMAHLALDIDGDGVIRVSAQMDDPGVYDDHEAQPLAFCRRSR